MDAGETRLPRAEEGREERSPGALPNPPVEGGQALPEGANEGLYPVVAQHHALREAQVELLHGSQRRDVGAGVGHQQLQQLQEFLRGSVCGAAPSEQRRPRIPPPPAGPWGAAAEFRPAIPPVPPRCRCHPGPVPVPTGQVDVRGPVAPLVGEAAHAAAVPGAVITHGLLRVRVSGQAGGRGQAGAAGAAGPERG